MTNDEMDAQIAPLLAGYKVRGFGTSGKYIRPVTLQANKSGEGPWAHVIITESERRHCDDLPSLLAVRAENVKNALLAGRDD